MDARRKDCARMKLRCDYCKKLLPQETVDLLVKEIGAENIAHMSDVTCEPCHDAGKGEIDNGYDFPDHTEF
jgi:5-methylcytosine-specific restriction endonuclease McrA